MEEGGKRGNFAQLLVELGLVGFGVRAQAGGSRWQRPAAGRRQAAAQLKLVVAALVLGGGALKLARASAGAVSGVTVGSEGERWRGALTAKVEAA